MKQGVGGTFAALASIFSLLGKLIYIIKHMPCTCNVICLSVAGFTWFQKDLA